MNLNQGDPITIIEKNDGTLSLSTTGEITEEQKTAVLSDEPTLSREIIAKYLLGFDTIKINFGETISVKQRDLVKKSIRRLVGVEIVEETSKEITLQCLLAPSAVDVRKTLKQAYFIGSDMHKDAMTAFLENDPEIAKLVITRDEDVDRLYYLIVRQLRAMVDDIKLSQKTNTSGVACLDYRVLAKSVENLADQAVIVAKKVVSLLEKEKEIPKGIKDKLRELSDVVFKNHYDAINAHFNKNIILAEEISKRKTVVLDLIEDIEKKIREMELDVFLDLRYILESLENINDYAIDIAELAIRE